MLNPRKIDVGTTHDAQLSYQIPDDNHPAFFKAILLPFSMHVLYI